MTDAADDMRTLKDRLLLAALPHVPFDGWSEASIARAAEEAGVERAAARRAFPRGPVDLVLHYSAYADRLMAEALAKEDLTTLKLRERVARAVRARLEPHAEEREAVRLALGLLALPQHGPDALRALYRTADAVWHAVGDRATDFSFYTKRALLSGVYLATVLCWLGDRSEGQAETWAFLARRIDDVMRIQKARGQLERLFSGGPGLLKALREGLRGSRADSRGRAA